MTKPISDEELDELKRLLEKATPGEWSWDKFRSASGAPVIVGPHWGGRTGKRDVCKVLFDPGSEDPQVHDNARLIVLLRNLAPRLLSHYRSARNDGIEDAARWHDERRRLTPDAFEMELHQVSAANIRALKSPPQSEPGTKP